MKKIIIIVGILLVIFIVGSATIGRIFYKKLGERTLEKAMERTTGGKVDINSDQNGDNVEMTWETENGQVQVSNKATLPTDFPSVIPLYQGFQIEGSMTTDNGASGTLSMIVADDADKVYGFYENEFKSGGWNISSTYSADDARYISVDKNDLRVSVIINTDSESQQTMIVISYGPNETD